MNKTIGLCACCVMAIPFALYGQDKAPAAAAPANPITVSEKGLYSFVSGAVVGAAEKMPEENYSFKPTPEGEEFRAVGGACGGRFGYVLLAGER